MPSLMRITAIIRLSKNNQNELRMSDFVLVAIGEGGCEYFIETTRRLII